MNFNLPSDFKFPFLPNKITGVGIFTSGFSKIEGWNGRIKFRDGNTVGEQEFNGATFDEVVLKMKAFADEMKSTINNESVSKIK